MPFGTRIRRILSPTEVEFENYDDNWSTDKVELIGLSTPLSSAIVNALVTGSMDKCYVTYNFGEVLIEIETITTDCLRN